MSGGEKQMDVRTALRQGLAQLREAKVPSFTLAAELLLLHALGRDSTWLYAHAEEQVSCVDADRFFALIARRARGEPTQHLTGQQEFWGLQLEVTPDVLIPRPETEHVIEVALDRLAVGQRRAGRKQALTGEGLQIADIGTGSGCIAIALAKELPSATIYATDISSAALSVAQRIAQTAAHLKPAGILVLELGHSSLPAVQPLLDAPAWTNVGVTNDLAGIPRVLAAERL